VLNLFLQAARPVRSQTLTRVFRQLGPLGLFLLAILDSSPLPTFAGPDILIAILAATRRHSWYTYAAVTTAGSVIGAYLTYRVARTAGRAWIDKKFGSGKVPAPLHLFEKWGTGTLVASTAIPFPLPTGMLFAAAGVSNYRLDKFLVIVMVCRAARYSAIALVADFYGRSFIRVLRHPTQYWAWLLVLTAAVAVLIAGGIWINRRLAAVPGSLDRGQWKNVPRLGE
jgi:membrane protein YqaA with SNARE-associated domain